MNHTRFFSLTSYSPSVKVMGKWLGLAAIVFAIPSVYAVEAHCFAKDKMKEKASHHFETADTNNDGVITETEMYTKMLEHFNDIDQNNNGEVTFEEMKQHHQAMKQKWFDHTKD